MQRFLLILSILLVSGGAWAGDAWSTFRDPGGLFAVDLPDAPQVTHRTVSGLNGKPVARDEYTVGRHAVAMVVTVSDLSQIADKRAVLDAAVKGAASGAARDLSDTPISLDGHPGRHVSFIDAHGSRFDDRLFLVDKKLVQVVAVQTRDASAPAIAAVQRFRASFHFVAP